jgi:hypothetical protein
MERYLVDQGCVPPLCDLLTVMDTKIIRVALNGLENILKVGDTDAKLNGETNKYALLVEESYGKSIHDRCFLYFDLIWHFVYCVILNYNTCMYL